MTGSSPDPFLSDDELDPTGIRDLLANLPDPGPMPDDLVARISQSLQLEQQRRTDDRTDDRTAASSPTVTSESDSNVTSLAAHRRRRPGRTVLWLGSAAAVAMVATVGANQFLGDGPSDSGVSAQYPAADSARDGNDSAGSHDAAAPAEADRGAGDESQADADTPAPTGADASSAQASPGTAGAMAEQDAQDLAGADVRVQTMQGTVQLTGPGLVSQVDEWTTSGPVSGTAGWTSVEATECITDQGLDTAGVERLLVSDALWDDQPAMLLVARGTDGATAWVLAPDCDRVLTGPTAVD